MSDSGAGRLTMLGTDDAQACEGDSCLVPSATARLSAVASVEDDDAVEFDPRPHETAAASTRAIMAALDEGASL